MSDVRKAEAEILELGMRSPFWKVFSDAVRKRLEAVHHQILTLDVSDPSFPSQYAELKGHLNGLTEALQIPSRVVGAEKHRQA